MEKTNSIIKQNVMRRVHAVHTMRLMGRIGISLLLFATSLYAVGREVWVARVFQNMPSLVDVSAVLSFFLSAFRGTQTVVQVTMLLSFAAALWLSKEIFTALQTPERRFA